jgi:hypothetical protein
MAISLRDEEYRKFSVKLIHFPQSIFLPFMAKTVENSIFRGATPGITTTVTLLRRLQRPDINPENPVLPGQVAGVASEIVTGHIFTCRRQGTNYPKQTGIPVIQVVGEK